MLSGRSQAHVMFVHALRSMGGKRKTLLLVYGGLILGLWMIFLVSQPPTLILGEPQRTGWIWCVLAWGLCWESGFYDQDTQGLLEHAMLQSGTVLPLMIGTWIGYWLFFLMPLLGLMHLLGSIPLRPDVWVMGSGLLSALSLSFYGLAHKDHRGAMTLASLPFIVPVVILCVHPLPPVAGLSCAYLSPNGWALLGLWGVLIPAYLWASQSLFKKSLSFPVILLHSYHDDHAYPSPPNSDPKSNHSPRTGNPRSYCDDLGRRGSFVEITP